MLLTSQAGVPASPMRLLEMLTDRFGVFEALAHSTIKLNRCTSPNELAMDPQVAEAVLELPTTCAPPAPPPAPGPRRRASSSSGEPRTARMTPEGEQRAEEAKQPRARVGRGCRVAASSIAGPCIG
jgi:hypothetical protein